MTEEVTLTKVTRNGQITLPAAVRRAVGIEEGDLVAVTIEGDTITLVPKKLVDKSQAYFWSDAWQQAEREASEDITQGRVRSFNDVEALIAALDAGKA
ncbi:MAG: AbrB/MazE/SpoVT family DNA-binding domain-containing protein [Anaerolineales bacterium]|nr:AbrB/MazE/SpoVT family DNA-binding domain-containing protein [Anaerolineales bacterium]